MKLNTPEKHRSAIAAFLVSLAALFTIPQALANTDHPLFMVSHPSVTTAEIKDIQESGDQQIRIVESYAAGEQNFTVFEAEDRVLLDNFLMSNAITAGKITRIHAINTPVRGGGVHAGDQPRPGHKTFVVQRKVPGVGLFSASKHEAIARSSNSAIEKIGDTIEWDHSYLTDTGTFCVYRAIDEATIREHGQMVGPEIVGLDTVDVIDVSEVSVAR